MNDDNIPNSHSPIRQERQAEWKRWMNPQRMLDREARLLSVLGVVTAPVLTLLVGHNVLSAQDATAIGSIVAALLVGFHGHGALQNRKNNAP